MQNYACLSSCSNEDRHVSQMDLEVALARLESIFQTRLDAEVAALREEMRWVMARKARIPEKPPKPNGTIIPSGHFLRLEENAQETADEGRNHDAIELATLVITQPQDDIDMINHEVVMFCLFRNLQATCARRMIT